MTRKLFATLLAVSMLLQTNSVFAVSEEKKDILASSVIDVFDDFESGNINADKVGSAFKVATIDNNKVLAFKTKGMGSANLGKHYPKGLEAGTYSISFDFYAEKLTSTVGLKILKQDSASISSGYYSFSSLQSTGNIETKRTLDWYYDYQLDYAYEAEKQYHIEVWVDTKNYELSMYMNDDLVYNIPLTDEVEQFKGYALTFAEGSDVSNIYIDNLRFRKVDNIIGEKASPLYMKATAPENVLGHNFTTDNPARFDVDIVNRNEQTVNAKFYYRTRTLGGKAVYSSKESAEDITIEPGETITKNLKIKKIYYGRMILELVAEIDGTEYTKNVQYAMINRTRSMPKNKKFGVATAAHDIDKKVELMNISGMGSLRCSVITWGTVEKQKGIYDFTEEINNRLNLIHDNGIYLLYLFANGNGTVYPDPAANGTTWLFPTTDEGLKGLENYMKELIKFANGRIDAVEVWNEYNNMSGPFRYNYKPMVNMHRAIWNAVKATDPNVLVSGIDTDTWGVQSSNELRDVLELMNGEELFDAFSIHPYTPTGGTPETGPIKICHDAMVDLFTKHGYDINMPINFSESGWSSSTCKWDRDLHAAYVVRNQPVSYTEVPNAILYNYTFSDLAEFNKRNSMNEATFGMTEAREWQATDIPYLAKETLVATGYFNNLMAEYKSVEKINQVTDNDDAKEFCYHFVSRNDEDVLMLGPVDEDAPIKFDFDLGTDSVVVGDMYGNEEKVCGIDGNYSFVVQPKNILYVRGKFGTIAKSDRVFTVSDDEKSVPCNYEFSITVTAPKNFKGTAFVKAEGLIQDEVQAEFIDGKAKLTFNTFEKPIKKAQIELCVKDTSGKIYYNNVIPIEYTTSASVVDVRWRPTGNRLDLWNLEFLLKNIREDILLSGTLEVDNGDKFILPNIAPNETRKMTIPLKRIAKLKDLGKFNGKFKLSTNDDIEIEINETMTGAAYAKTKPKIDGIMSKGEWDDVKVLKLDVNSIEQVYGTKANWTGPDDASFETYIKYDMDNFYMISVVKDDIFRQVNSYNAMWNGDSMQVLIGFDKTLTGTQYGIGLADGTTPTVYRNAQEANIGGFDGIMVTGIEDKAECQIVRNGEYTTYEVRIPWEVISFNKTKITPGQKIFFSVLYNDDDGKNRENWIEYANNCIGSGSCANKRAVETLLIPSGSITK